MKLSSLQISIFLDPLQIMYEVKDVYIYPKYTEWNNIKIFT